MKGDILIDMGDIEKASICYKRAMFTSMESQDGEDEDAKVSGQETNNSWADTLIAIMRDEESEAIPASDSPSFECPKCRSMIDICKKLCTYCGTVFPEEEFKNPIGGLDDDLVFFEHLKRLLSTRKKVFIHFDYNKGQICFLDRRRNESTGITDYIFVRGAVESLSWDYSFGMESDSDILG
jgi:hypothetical protein